MIVEHANFCGNMSDYFLSLATFIYISANGDSYTNMTVPTFRSESNSATLRFTTDYDITQTGILMAYVSSKNSYI